MRFILSIMMISVLAVLIACTSSAAPTSIKPITESKTSVPAPTTVDGHDHAADTNAARISLEDAKKAFDANEAVFVDTRYADAFALEHVKGAVNIPANDIDKRFSELPKGKKIIAYCS